MKEKQILNIGDKVLSDYGQVCTITGVYKYEAAVDGDDNSLEYLNSKYIIMYSDELVAQIAEAKRINKLADEAKEKLLKQGIRI